MKLKKLSDYAKEYGVTYRTAWNRYNKGLIPNSFQDKDGHVYIKEYSENKSDITKACLYARVSSSENKINLDTQMERLSQYAIAKGYVIDKAIKEVGSGVNDSRQKLIEILSNQSFDILIVEHKDRLTRFGFNYIETLLNVLGKKIEVINYEADIKNDLMQDLVSIIYSFSARLYGLRRAKNKSKEILEVIESNKD